MLTGNKGEWSEIYTLFKLLGDKQVFGGDADLNKVEGLIYPIIKILRIENDNNFEYALSGNIVIISNEKEILKVPIKEFTYQASRLLSKIKASKGAFSIVETEQFMNAIHCKSIKAKATKKTDIYIVIHDVHINRTLKLGFSIKSYLGSIPTLLNAGHSTNFIYKINSLHLSQKEILQINEINTASKIKDRIKAVKQAGGVLKFETLEQAVFKNNLVLIDSLLPNILAEMVKTFYGSEHKSINELTLHINQTNPLKYDNQFAHCFYEYKIKRFLTDVALGMTPSEVWDGIHDATGGYLVVKESGDILCYHIYNRNKFEEYLFNNTKLETASSTRHEFGKIYSINDNYYIKLNLQIRFI